MRRNLSLQEWLDLLDTGLPESAEPRVGDLFMENTSLTPERGKVLGMHIAALAVPYFRLRFLHPFWSFRGEEISLEYHTEEDLPGAHAFSLIRRRRSPHHGVQDAPVPFRSLGSLLHYAYGVVGKETVKLKGEKGQSISVERLLRPIPSAGALYPLEVFIVPRRVDNLVPALYHYMPVRNALTRVSDPLEDPQWQHLLSLIPGIPEHFPWAAVILICAVPMRQTLKYGQRAYRFVLQESGHLAQNMALVATALGLAVLPIGGFYDRPLLRLLHRWMGEPVPIRVIYPLALGVPVESTEEEEHAGEIV